MKSRPALPKGTRDFNSIQLYKRNYIIEKIRDNFLKFGFNQLKLPALKGLVLYWVNMEMKVID